MVSARPGRRASRFSRLGASLENGYDRQEYGNELLSCCQGEKIQAKTRILVKYFLAAVLKKPHFDCSRGSGGVSCPK